MPKQRLTSLDIHAISSELESLVSYRLQNIYDINSRTFLLKFGLPDNKKNIIVESGFRLHLTNYSREKSSSPSHFVAKFLKTRRLTGLFQLGTDRILVFSFGNDSNVEKSYHLVFEFFSAGNIILVSSTFKILHVLRTFRPNIPPGADPDTFQVYELGSHYGTLERHFSTPWKYEAMTMGRLKGILKANVREEPEEEERNALMPQGDVDKKKKSFKKKKEVKNTVRKALLNGAAEYGAQLVEQVIRASRVDGNTLIHEVSLDGTPWGDVNIDDSHILLSLLEHFIKADEIVKQCEYPAVKGYITTKPSKDTTSTAPNYEDFTPFKQTHLPSDLTLLEYENFNLALDTFFSHAEATKVLTKHIQAQNTASSRLNAARTEHTKRLSTLRSVQELNVLKATLLKVNLERVEECLRSINGLLTRGMDWGDIEKLINLERTRGNPVAEIIVELKFKQGKVVLGLQEDDEEEDTGDETDDEQDIKTGKIVHIEVDLGLSAWANAREYFDKKKVAAEKETRTAQSSSRALKNAERKITADLNRNLKEEKPLMKSLREIKWFEKFYWFISSEGYLVLGARDTLQTELLLRKYFRKGDVYVHSDLQNSCVVIIKNPIEDGVVPPGTLSQAGIMSVATSRAWDVKQGFLAVDRAVLTVVTSAWWVPYSQVQRRDAGYEIRGKKTYLSPAMLVLGYGILWTTEDEETMERHKRTLTADTSETPTNADVDDADTADDDDIAGQVEEQPNAVDANNETDSDDTESNKLDEDDDGQDQDKYNLAEFGSASEHEEEQPESKSAQPSKRHLSAKQRRDMKKGKTQQSVDSDSDIDDVISSIDTLCLQKKPQPKVRGKKGKMKKIKARYADQSDEERELARKLLGAKPEKPQESEVKLVEEVKAPTPKPKPTPRLPPKPPVDELLETLDLSLDGLIAAPKSGDIISDAIAVCAPWSALTRYKYKVKLIPGTTKKGKAARAVVGGFLATPVDDKGEDAGKMSPREKELLKSLKDEEIIPCIWPKSVKVVGAKIDAGKGKKSGNVKGKGKK